MNAFETAFVRSGMNTLRAKLAVMVAGMAKDYPMNRDARARGLWMKLFQDRDMAMEAMLVLDEIFLSEDREAGAKSALIPTATLPRQIIPPAQAGGGGGQMIAETQKAFAASNPTPDHSGSVGGANRRMKPRGLVPRRRSASEMAAFVSARKSVFDTYHLADGTAIGDVKFSQIPKLKAKYCRHAELLGLIHNHARPDDPMASVRDVVNETTLQQFIQKAAQLEDAAHA